MTQSGVTLQVLSTFNAEPMEAALQRLLSNSGIAQEIGFTDRREMSGYMVAPAWNTEQIAGTVVIVRVEDWLRDGRNAAAGNSGNLWARKELQARVKDFANEISLLAYRGKPVWFMACPSAGWFAEQNNLQVLCRTYTNLLAARVKNLSQVTSLNWPAALSDAGFDDHPADELQKVPFTQVAFDRLAEFVSGQVTRTVAQTGSIPTSSTTTGSPELAAYLLGLRVAVEMKPASESERGAVDRILRTAASFSLTGERPNISDAEVTAIVDSGHCMLVHVTDRLNHHGPSGVVVYRQSDSALIVEAMSLSCTVLGKQVEYALLSALKQLAAERFCSKLLFQYKQSGRNQTILTFLESVADPDRGTDFVLPVDSVSQRISAKAVNPGAWTLSLGEIKNPATGAQ
jgi:hypothetical protein